MHLFWTENILILMKWIYSQINFKFSMFIVFPRTSYLLFKEKVFKICTFQ